MIPISLYKNRRKKIVEILANEGITSGIILLIAAFEDEKKRFLQESFFWYLTGINEPGVVLLIDLDTQQTILFIPDFKINRSLWTLSCLDDFINKNILEWGIDRVEKLGFPYSSYHTSAFFHADYYVNVISYIRNVLEKDKKVYTIKPSLHNVLLGQQVVLFGLKKELADLEKSIHDITSHLIKMRRIKDKYEIEAIFKAIDITIEAQQAAALTIAPDCSEAELQAAAEYLITGSGADVAFPSIIASGFFSTVLHYVANSSRLVSDASVLIDIGAQKNHYCADLARTYPVSGKFSKRQKEVYQVVLDAHLHVVQYAQPGYWLNNKKYPEKSLQHIAKAYFKKYGFHDYFNHGIGHMLGLDVHDCDDPQMPLEVGVVFTIEPGLYIAAEAIGIRIEDNYWLTEKGPICLSDRLVQEIIDIEKLIQKVD